MGVNISMIWAGIASHIIIHFVSDEYQEVEFGNEEKITLGVSCNDIQAAPNGDILAASDDGLIVLSAKSGEKVNTCLPGCEIFSVDVSNDRIIVGAVEGIMKTSIVILNSTYAEVSRWTVDKMPIDLAAFITHGLHNNIPQYEASTGEVQNQLRRDSQPHGIAAFKPNSIITTDGEHNTVHKFNIGKGEQRRWTFTDVIEPYSVIVDDRGIIWVRSNRYDRFTLISRNGKANVKKSIKMMPSYPMGSIYYKSTRQHCMSKRPHNHHHHHHHHHNHHHHLIWMLIM